MLEHYVKKILTSRVYDVAIETPLQPARQLSERIGNQILLKREDLQPVFSFKIRGAYNRIAQLSEEQKAKGVICALRCGGIRFSPHFYTSHHKLDKAVSVLKALL